MANRNFVVNLIIGARDQATRVIGGLNTALGKLNNRVTQVGAALAAFFGAQAIGSFFKNAIGLTVNFQTQMLRVKAATNATTEEMEQLAAAAKKAGDTTQFNATEAAQALETFGLAGVSAADSIKLLPTILDATVASGTDLATTTQLLLDALGAYGKGVGDAARFADVLAKGAAISKAGITDLGVSLSYAGVQASQMGLSIEQTVAAFVALDKSGIRAERAGTALRAVLSAIQDPASLASQELRKLGIDTNNVFDVIEGLAKAGKAAEPAILSFGLVAGPGLRTLIQVGTEAMGGFTTELNNSAGAAHKVASIFGEGVDGAIKNLASSWDGLRRTLVEPLLGPIQKQIESLTQTFLDFTSGGQIKTFQDQLVSAFGSGVKAIKDFVVESGGIPGILGTITKYTDKASQVLGSFAANTRVIAGGVTLVFNGITIFLRGIQGFIAGTVSAIARSMLFLANIGNKVGVVSDSVLSGIRAVADSADAAWDKTAKGINQDVSDIADAFTMMTESAGEAARAQEKAATSAEEAAQRQAAAADSVKETSIAYKFLAAEIKAAADAQAVAAQRERAGALFAKGKLDVEEYNQALEQANERLGALAKAAPAAAAQIGHTGAQAEGAAKGVNKANDALKALLAQRAQIVKGFQDLQAQITAGPKKPDSELTVLDINRQFNNAQTAFNKGDLDTALKQLARGREVIQALFEQGAASKQYLLAQTQRLAELAKQGNAAQGAVTQATAEQQMAKARNEIEGLLAKAQPLQALTIGFDVTAAEQSAEALRARLEKILAQDPILVSVQMAQRTGQPPGGVEQKATGGLIRGPGTPTSDSVLARLSNGEYVVRAAAVSKYGTSLLDAINHLSLPGFATGGLVDNLRIPSVSAPASAGATGTPVHLHLGGQSYQVSAAPDVAAALAATVRREALKAGRQ